MAQKKQKQGEAHNLNDLLILKLQSLYDIENELVKALPKMAQNATSDDLREAFEDHLEETKGHVERLEEMFSALDTEPKAEKVAAIRGLIEDAQWIIKHIRDEKARDAALIAAAQYVERYETAGYGSARAWARMLEQSEVEELLSKTLKEEEAANQKLTALAEDHINEEAKEGVEETSRM